MKQHKAKIIGLVFILCVLAGTYFLGGNYAGRDGADQGETPFGTALPETSETRNLVRLPDNPPIEGEATTGAPTPLSETDLTETSANGDKQKQEKSMVINPETGKDKYLTDPVPKGRPLPVEPEDVKLGEKVYTCTLSVRCDTILANMKHLDPEKVELVPKDGTIFPAAEVIFYEGESVFNLLQREMKKNKIHMEFRNTPIYNSAYIRGINNLYEFDVGELSGWMYKVNNWFPNYGVSRYQLKVGDVVEFVYTCDLGRDVGGYYAMGGE